MKKILFFAVFFLSVGFCVMNFKVADATRGYNATGGEVFTIALPLWIMYQGIKTVRAKRKKIYMSKLHIVIVKTVAEKQTVLLHQELKLLKA